MTCIQNGRIVLLLAVLFFLTCAARAQTPLLDGCGDESCPIPTVDESNQPVYAIVSPVGYHAVEAIKQAPRLETLAQETKKTERTPSLSVFQGGRGDSNPRPSEPQSDALIQLSYSHRRNANARHRRRRPQTTSPFYTRFRARQVGVGKLSDNISSPGVDSRFENDNTTVRLRRPAVPES